MKTLQVTDGEGYRPLRRQRAAAEKVALSCTCRHITTAKMSSKVQQKFKMREKAELGLIFVHLFHSLVQLVRHEVTREQIISLQAFLCGVCMFCLCLCGFASRSPRTFVRVVKKILQGSSRTLTPDFLHPKRDSYPGYWNENTGSSFSRLHALGRSQETHVSCFLGTVELILS